MFYPINDEKNSICMSITGWDFKQIIVVLAKRKNKFMKFCGSWQPVKKMGFVADKTKDNIFIYWK